MQVMGLLAVFSVLVPTKIWFAPDQGLMVNVKADSDIALVVTDFNGKTIGSPVPEAAGKTLDLKQVFPDLAQPGTYIVTFAKLTKKPKGFLGPDGFHNLYNDAERNQKEYPELTIQHQAPGKKDYYFDLRIAGRDEVAPGPKALTQIKR